MPFKISRSVYSPVPVDLLDEAILGDNKANTLYGTTTKTVFFGGGGNDKIVGDNSVTDSNTAVYTYSIDKYSITTTRDGFTVKALNSNEGTDTLVNVSKLIFAGVTYEVHASPVGTPATVSLWTPPTSSPTPIVSEPTPPTTTDTSSGTSTTTESSTSTTGSSTSTTDTSTQPTSSGTTTTSESSGGSLSSGSGSAVLVTPTTTDPAPTTTDPAPTTSDPTPPQSAPVTSAPGDVVGFSLQNTSGAPESTGYVTFGQVFEKGSVMPGDTIVARINGQDVAVQMDVKTTNADGSVAHAILTFKAPAIATDSSITGMFAKVAPSGSTTPAIQAQDIVQHGYNFKVDVTLHNADGSTTVKTIDAAQLLQQAISSGSVETWMKGSQASEYRVSTTIAPNLDVKFDIRMDADGKTHTDVIFARDDAYTTNTSTLTYDVKFTQNGQTVFTDSNIQQYAYSTWHHDVSSAGSIDPHVVYDVAYLIKTGAIPAYDLSSGVNASTIAGYVQQLSQADTGPMGNALVTKYIPSTGGRADIGPETTWTATYLVSQNADAAKVMYANADASGSVPWHVIDANGDPIRIDLHPNLWLDGRGWPDRYGPDSLPNAFNTDGSGWWLDVAHQPSLTYVPYLLSGDHYYLDELQAQASYTIASIDPGYRDQDSGILSDVVTQVRAMAWGLRDISNAAYITPDADAMKSYFTTILNNNLDYLINTYVNGPQGDKEGALEGWITQGYSWANAISPWQQDYLSISLQYLADKGFTKADTLLNWMDNFLSGRFINEAAGYDPLHGATYNIQVSNPATGELYQTWAEVYQATFGNTVPTTIDDMAYPNWAGGYAANAKASLAGLISSTQSPDAIEAYGWLQSQTTAMLESYKSDPTWNIAPRLANGEYLTNDEISVVSNSGGGSLTGTDKASMLVGSDGGDTLTGGSGISLLVGLGGDDTLKAGAGNSYLIGGDGDDRLQVTAAGTDADQLTLKGGTGRDVFAFVAGAHATITDFKSSDDRIELSGVNAGDVKVTSSGGSTTIDLTNNGRITLAGTTLSQSVLNISYT